MNKDKKLLNELISDNQDQITELQKIIHNIQRNNSNMRIALLNLGDE